MVDPDMGMPNLQGMDQYETVTNLGWVEQGFLRDKQTREIFVVKYIKRGELIDETVKREIIKHRSLIHPNIIKFKEVILTPTHLVIVMEYASGMELFEHIRKNGRFNEDEARLLFQQLVSGVRYCHSMEVFDRYLRLNRTMLDGSPTPRLKICEFGYSNSSVTCSPPNRTVNTPIDVAPEILNTREYDPKIADVWSCGVILYVMLVGECPFADPDEPKNFRKTIQRILSVQYSIPDDVNVSTACRHLISRIFSDSPSTRITMAEILNNEWFLQNLPADLMDESNQFVVLEQPKQSIDEIIEIIAEATIPEAV